MQKHNPDNGSSESAGGEGALRSVRPHAQEHSERIGAVSVAQSLAPQLGIPWLSIEMTTQEKLDAGILEAQSNRPGMFQPDITCRIPSGDIREEAWIAKLLSGSSGTTIVVCGYLHCAALVMKLRAKGHTVDQRVFLETVPQILQAQGIPIIVSEWLSETRPQYREWREHHDGTRGTGPPAG